MTHDQAFVAGTTSIQAADAEGWVVSITPSGGWIPAFIAGDTGVGLSQRMQSFGFDQRVNPFNVLEPGQAAARDAEPELAMRDGKPFLSFAVQGGDAQDQNLLQFFLDVVEFGMNVQQAAEAANINSYQMHDSFGDHTSEPGRLVVRSDTPSWVRAELERMGYRIETVGKAPPDRSTPSTSIKRTARCGADRATSARTTASPGECRARPRLLHVPFRSVQSRGPIAVAERGGRWVFWNGCREAGSAQSSPSRAAATRSFETMHTIGMALLIGSLGLIDLRVLGYKPELPIFGTRDLLPLAWLGFTLNAISGTALFTSDAVMFFESYTFRIKIAADHPRRHQRRAA